MALPAASTPSGIVKAVPDPSVVMSSDIGKRSDAHQQGRHPVGDLHHGERHDEDGMPMMVMPQAVTRPKAKAAASASRIAIQPCTGTFAMFT